VANRDIRLHYVSTIDQLADIFTKGHSADQLCFLRAKLKVIPPLNLRGGVEENQNQKMSNGSVAKELSSST